MPLSVQILEYFYTRVEERPGNAYQMLAQLASEEVNLLAFSAVPFGPNYVEFTIFTENTANLARAAEKFGWTLIGPQHAIVIQGDDRLGALAEVHKKLAEAKVSVYASSGVTDGRGHYGYVIYVKEGDHTAAAQALG